MLAQEKYDWEVQEEADFVRKRERAFDRNVSPGLLDEAMWEPEVLGAIEVIRLQVDPCNIYDIHSRAGLYFSDWPNEHEAWYLISKKWRRAILADFCTAQGATHTG